MPLDEVGKRYANDLFVRETERAVREHQAAQGALGRDFAARHMLRSGGYVKELVRLHVEFVEKLARAKVESLLRAYNRSGIQFDDAAVQEIGQEVAAFCEAKRQNVTDALAAIVRQTFGEPAPAGLAETVSRGADRGVSQIRADIERDLRIKRDEFLLEDVRRKAYGAATGKRWDLFISHASEDKDAFVRPLAEALVASGLDVWYDESQLTIGDSLRRKIDEGLARSRFGVVVLSHNFFAKAWPQNELDGLMAREIEGVKVILPVWYRITREQVTQYSPMLAARLAARSEDGVQRVVQQIREAMGISHR